MHSIHDLMRLTGYNDRSIRHFIRQGYIPRPVHAGRATKYSREHLVRLLALRPYRTRTLSIVAKRIASMSLAEVEALIAPPAAATPALAPAPAPAPSLRPSIASVASAELAPPPVLSGARATFVPVVEGVTLVVVDGAPQASRTIAHRILRRYARPTA